MDKFTVILTETRVTTKEITLPLSSGEYPITGIISAENYVCNTMYNLGFEELSNFTSVQEGYELTYNGKSEWEMELQMGGNELTDE